jgi:multiple antibiotic resistance protein
MQRLGESPGFAFTFGATRREVLLTFRLQLDPLWQCGGAAALRRTYDKQMDFASAVVTLFFVMDPLGNVPVFLSVLKNVEPTRRRKVLFREVSIAYAVLIVFVAVGTSLMRVLGLDREAVSIAGGIVLFLIALRMIFPGEGSLAGDPLEGEPFIVPLAIPLIVGPSTLATVLLLEQTSQSSGSLVAAITLAWAASAAILFSSTFLYRALGQRGLIALERLMGMLLVMVAVQMLLNGVKATLVD